MSGATSERMMCSTGCLMESLSARRWRWLNDGCLLVMLNEWMSPYYQSENSKNEWMNDDYSMDARWTMKSLRSCLSN